MAVELADGTYWLSKCFEITETSHLHVSVYLIENDRGFTLIDTGSHNHLAEIESETREIVGDQPVNSIVLSHIDLPHAENVSPLMERWPGASLYSAAGNPATAGIPDRIFLGQGPKDISGRRYEFIQAPLADRQHTLWTYDTTTEILFTADGLGNYHRPNQCTAVSTEIDGGIEPEDIYRFHKYELRWLRLVDPEKICADLDTIFDEFDVEYIAPIHGNPIQSVDVDDYRSDLYESIRRLDNEYWEAAETA